MDTATTVERESKREVTLARNKATTTYVSRVITEFLPHSVRIPPGYTVKGTRKSTCVLIARCYPCTYIVTCGSVAQRYWIFPLSGTYCSVPRVEKKAMEDKKEKSN